MPSRTITNDSVIHYVGKSSLHHQVFKVTGVTTTTGNTIPIFSLLAITSLPGLVSSAIYPVIDYRECQTTATIDIR